MSAEKVLIKTLLANYDDVGVVGRPVINTSETINVSYGIGLIQILDLDEKNQILTTNVWCRYVRILSLRYTQRRTIIYFISVRIKKNQFRELLLNIPR